MLEFVVNTDADEALLAAVLPSWVEKAKEHVLVPLLEEMQRRAGQPNVISQPDTPGGCHALFTVEMADSLRTTSYKYGEAGWRRILHGLGENRWRSVTLGAWILDSLGAPSDALPNFAFVIDLKAFEWPGTVHLIGLNATDDLARDVLRGDQQRRLVELVKGASVDLAGSTAYVTRGQTYFWETMHERSIGISNGRDFSAQWLRGYFWGNFLNDEHIRKVGGAQRVLKSAPCHLVEELHGKRRRLLYLQLTPDLWDVSEEQLDELRQFLEPALLPEEVARSAAGEGASVGTSSPEDRRPENASHDWVHVSDDFDPTGAQFTLELDGALTPRQLSAVERFLGSWYDIGILGGFGGYFHNMSGVDVENRDSRTFLRWSMDFGSAGGEALVVLADCLAELASLEQFRVHALTVG